MSRVESINPAHMDAERGKQVRRDDRAHVFHSWSAQAEIDPIAIAGGKGSYFWDYDGKRYLALQQNLWAYSGSGSAPRA